MEALRAEDPAYVGQFRLLARLGAGGMGRVYLARSGGGRTVAVKLVQPELARQPAFRERFAREVAAARRAGGEWTADVIDADTDAEVPWVATSYIPGPSLRDAVGREFGPLPVDTVRVLAHGLAQALEAIHAGGLVHRDLKPSNVLLAVQGPRIIDFGIARALDPVTGEGVLTLTGTGELLGSPGFMSPEQVRGERVGTASDIFCLGSLLAYAASGVQPFGDGASGAHAVMFKIANDEPELPGPDDLPGDLAGLVRACLRKDPAARPSAASIAAHLSAPPGPWLPAGVLALIGERNAELLDFELEASARGGEPGGGAEPGGGGTFAREVAGAATQGPGGAAPSTGGTDKTGGTGTGAAPGRPRRRHRAVIAVCTVLALAAGGAYAAYEARDRDEKSAKPGGGTGKPVAPPPTPTPSGGTTQGAGIVPAGFLGAWEGVVRGTHDNPSETRRVEIGQGRTGEKAGTYVMVGPDRLCMGRSVLVKASDDAVVLGESNVTASVPAKRCKPSARQTLTLRSADLLEWKSGSETATLKRAKAGAEAVPARFVGEWKNAPSKHRTPEEQDRYQTNMTVTQGPVGAPLVRIDESYPRTGDEGQPVEGDVRCIRTATVGGVGNLVIVGPALLNPDESDAQCVTDLTSRSLHIIRWEGKEMLQDYSMGTDSEPGEYVRYR
ncbi:serine/threonine protein kinase [Streptomyces sp. NBC_00237]|uniref:serine/threonine-protein kinase n=1 Tax=Streptomyces sp. NBC_00237 TaxID=2975687 RepID=UPI0022573EFB|nr:serine/threonine-protein kinase [Streptomyces sp. NBC_00237]MCX5207279.1 serine/threonine protein kinase [Streptomyces sp. NBC_00237]